MTEKLIENGQVIKSKRGTVLICYCVMPVYTGIGDEIVRYEYSFWTKNKKCKTIKQWQLSDMLQKSYSIQN